MALSPDTRSQIETLLRQHTIVLFMKGSRQMPRCGFSAKVIEILEGHGIDYRDVDVLSDPALREGIKEFSNWPTIPQLFFQGSLIGGSDIVRQLDESGELLQALGIDPSKVSIEPPRISITPEAAAAIKDAGKEAEPGQHLRMVLSRGGQNIDLYFDAAKASDLRVEQHGITVLFDRASARLASGISIAYVDGPGGGFRIDNPNLPAQVGTLTPAELRKMMDAKVPLRLIDVRTERERAIARILPDVTLDQIAPELDSLPKDTMLVFYCHSGVRSRAAAEQALARGFRNVWNLNGGIDGWSRQVDKDVPRY
ncbi:MAG TPA: Grx4 family monothiol glutaredoxin [Pseudomonadota bacterium]|jgi:monothiol glutaredoxin|nr:Grx4 family monothiol glutaredoxin [Pseudomonadota bacterium]HNK43233.1 Grx4 family monothiol glutaredoxin [Pseudomonadota bacterium]